MANPNPFRDGASAVSPPRRGASHRFPRASSIGDHPLAVIHEDERLGARQLHKEQHRAEAKNLTGAKPRRFRRTGYPAGDHGVRNKGLANVAAGDGGSGDCSEESTPETKACRPFVLCWG